MTQDIKPTPEAAAMTRSRDQGAWAHDNPSTRDTKQDSHERHGSPASRRVHRHTGRRPGARRPHRPGATPRQRSRILVVDDDEDLAVSAKEAIERFVPGSQVTIANSYASGITALESSPVDLALVDYKMPGRDGLDFVARANELEPGLPVILMTGFGSVDVAARAINRHHVAGFLPKPFDAVVLAETVQSVLRRLAH